MLGFDCSGCWGSTLLKLLRQRSFSLLQLLLIPSQLSLLIAEQLFLPLYRTCVVGEAAATLLQQHDVTFPLRARCTLLLAVEPASPCSDLAL